MEIKTKVKKIEKEKIYYLLKYRKQIRLFGPGEYHVKWDNWAGVKVFYLIKPYNGREEIQWKNIIGTIENNKLILWHEFSNQLTEQDKKQIVEFVGRIIEI